MRNGQAHEPDQRREAMVFECKRPGCGQWIFLANVKRHDGEIRRVPIDDEPTVDGNVVFEGGAHYLVMGERAEGLRYTSHHKTCKGERTADERGRA